MKLALIQTAKGIKDMTIDVRMLGLLSIATYLKEHWFWNVHLVDACFSDPLREIKKIKPKLLMSILKNVWREGLE